MGLFDTILGRTKPIGPKLDALFALPSAAITLESAAGLVASGHAGVCFKAPPGPEAAELQKEIEQLLELPDAPNGTPSVGPAMTQSEDSFGYRWLVVHDPDIGELVTRVHTINSTLNDAGFGAQLLCSVFHFVPARDAGPDTKAVYMVYLFKRAAFYPFAPDGHEHRNSEEELRLRGVLGSDLPIETDVSRWFPLWEIPVS